MKYSYIGCVSGGLERDFIFLLESDVLFLFVFLLPAPVSGNPAIKQRRNNTELKIYQAAIFTSKMYNKLYFPVITDLKVNLLLKAQPPLCAEDVKTGGHRSMVGRSP